MRLELLVFALFLGIPCSEGQLVMYFVNALGDMIKRNGLRGPLAVDQNTVEEPPAAPALNGHLLAGLKEQFAKLNQTLGLVDVPDPMEDARLRKLPVQTFPGDAMAKEKMEMEKKKIMAENERLSRLPVINAPTKDKMEKSKSMEKSMESSKNKELHQARFTQLKVPGEVRIVAPPKRIALKPQPSDQPAVTKSRITLRPQELSNLNLKLQPRQRPLPGVFGSPQPASNLPTTRANIRLISNGPANRIPIRTLSTDRNNAPAVVIIPQNVGPPGQLRPPFGPPLPPNHFEARRVEPAAPQNVVAPRLIQPPSPNSRIPNGFQRRPQPGARVPQPIPQQTGQSRGGRVIVPDLSVPFDSRPRPDGSVPKDPRVEPVNAQGIRQPVQSNQTTLRQPQTIRVPGKPVNGQNSGQFIPQDPRGAQSFQPRPNEGIVPNGSRQLQGGNQQSQNARAGPPFRINTGNFPSNRAINPDGLSRTGVPVNTQPNLAGKPPMPNGSGRVPAGSEQRPMDPRTVPQRTHQTQLRIPQLVRRVPTANGPQQVIKPIPQTFERPIPGRPISNARVSQLNSQGQQFQPQQQQRTGQSSVLQRAPVQGPPPNQNGNPQSRRVVDPRYQNLPRGWVPVVDPRQRPQPQQAPQQRQSRISQPVSNTPRASSRQAPPETRVGPAQPNGQRPPQPQPAAPGAGPPSGPQPQVPQTGGSFRESLQNVRRIRPN